jgi:hypothetical protein
MKECSPPWYSAEEENISSKPQQQMSLLTKHKKITSTSRKTEPKEAIIKKHPIPHNKTNIRKVKTEFTSKISIFLKSWNWTQKTLHSKHPQQPKSLLINFKTLNISMKREIAPNRGNMHSVPPPPHRYDSHMQTQTPTANSQAKFKITPQEGSDSANISHTRN